MIMMLAAFVKLNTPVASFTVAFEVIDNVPMLGCARVIAAKL